MGALASRRALVAQQEPLGFDWRVEELVCLGCNPEKALIAELLDDLDLIHLAKRSALTLSGGERQRVMRQLRVWAEQHQMAIVCVLHDLNLASTYSDRVWLLNKGQRISHGLPNQVLSLDTIADIYAAELQLIRACPAASPFLALRP